MAKNMHSTRDAQVTLAVPVAVGTKSGDVVLVGTAGLWGHALTDRATPEARAVGLAAHSLPDGYATVELVNVHKTLTLLLADSVSIGDKVYRKASDGTFTTTASGNLLIGYAIEDIASGARGPVALK